MIRISPSDSHGYNNIHNSTAFDELERFISIYNPSETIFIHNYEKPYKVHDIINFIGLTGIAIVRKTLVRLRFSKYDPFD